MKNFFLKNKTLIILGFLVFLGLFTILPTETFAQESYKFLQPLPGVAPELSGDKILSTYLSGLFKLLISLAIMLSIGMIVLGGLQYLGGEAAKTKGAGIQRLNGAMFGLAIALFAWLFLNTINPALTEFNLDITIDDVKNISGIPEQPGWFYSRINSDGILEWVGVGNRTESTENNYSGCPGGIAPDEPSDECIKTKIVYTYERGFYTVKSCENAIEEEKEARSGTVVSSTCVGGDNENGAWYFVVSDGRYGREESVGLFPDMASCEVEYQKVDDAGDLRMQEDCAVDFSRATEDTELTGMGDNWYFGLYNNNYSETIPKGPFTTAERCGNSRKSYTETTDCVEIKDGKLTGATAGMGSESNADYVANLPETCDSCQTIPSEIPVKSRSSGEQLNIDVVNRLLDLTEDLKTAKGGVPISWQITEAYKPTIKHASPCHADGRCFDANLSGSDKSSVEIALESGNINGALNILQPFMEAALANGFKPYYEVQTSAQRLLLKTNTNLSDNTLFRYIPGINANHFHIE